MAERRLYLAFTQYEPEEDSITERFIRAVIGPVDHVEFVLKEGTSMTRYIVAAPNKHRDARMYKTHLRFDERGSWLFLRLLLEPAKVELVLEFLERSLANGTRFSNFKSFSAGGPPVWYWLWALAVGPDDAIPEPGPPMFCAEMCALALQHAGLIAHVPADSCTPNDLWVHVSAFTQPEDDAFGPPPGADSLGLPLSEESFVAFCV